MFEHSKWACAAVVLGSMVLNIGLASAAERSKVSPTIVPNFDQPDLSAKNNGYTMTPEELKLDCKRLTGRMQIRIRQLRVTAGDKKTSELGRGMQQAATPFLAGTTRGIDPDGDRARELAQVRAYNARLTEKNCQPFDLEADLKPGATTDPRPIPKPPTVKPKAVGIKPAAGPAVAPAIPAKVTTPAAAPPSAKTP